MYIYMCVFKHLTMYVYVYTHTHTHTSVSVCTFYDSRKRLVYLNY